MIGVAAERSQELLPLRVRLRGVGTIDDETERRDHQPGWQIHLTDQEISGRLHICTGRSSFVQAVARHRVAACFARRSSVPGVVLH